MTRKRAPAAAGGAPDSAVGRRVADVLQRLFAGNQSAMAKAIGVSHAAISQIVHGKRQPGPRVLQAIAGLPGVSPDWAILGKGAAPAVPVQRDPNKCFLPVVASLDFALSAEPTRTRTSRGLQVAASEYSPSRIVFQVPQRHVCILRSGGRLKPGDFLIFETDRGLWLSKPQHLGKRLCLIAVQDDKGQMRGELVRVDFRRPSAKNPQPQLRVQRLYPILDRDLLPVPQPNADRCLEKFDRLSRCIILPGSTTPKGLPADPPRKRHEIVEPEEILAVAVRLIAKP
jgi:transcriptional regulator with XRE-family HTH domain